MLNLLQLSSVQRCPIISRYPKVERDLSCVILKTTSDRELFFMLQTIKIMDLRDFFIHDVFQICNNTTFICICVRFSVQSLLKTLCEGEIKEIVILILNLLYRAVGALFRF